MSVEEAKFVDAIGIERDSGQVVLTITDHLVWDIANEHLVALQEKINSYVGFIDSGELLKEYARAIGRKVRIDVVCKYPPSADGERFLAAARTAVEGVGIGFSWRVPAA